MFCLQQFSSIFESTVYANIFGPRCDKTNNVTVNYEKMKVSLGISISDQSLCCSNEEGWGH